MLSDKRMQSHGCGRLFVISWTHGLRTLEKPDFTFLFQRKKSTGCPSNKRLCSGTIRDENDADIRQRRDGGGGVLLVVAGKRNLAYM